jgi:predicted metal-dependent peptidase
MNPQNRLSAALTKIRMKNPFLGTLGLFVEHRLDESIPTACTDDRTVWYNPKFVDACSLNEIGGVVLHELLHAALLHNSRRGEREARLWNIAADIVVNGIVLQEDWVKLPLNPVVDKRLEHLRVEEVYSYLQENGCSKELRLPDEWLDLSPGNNPGESNADDTQPQDKLKAHWKQAWRQAQLVNEMRGNGNLGANLRRLLNEVTTPQVDWKTRLWQYLSSTPNDFNGWDRRFIHRGLYLESLEGETLRASLCVDTSGSVDSALLGQFLAELRSILRAYPAVELDLYYADATLDGPHSLRANDELPAPTGGGGTSFVPFFQELEQSRGGDRNNVAIYLTDGFGQFPLQIPAVDTLWVAPTQGLPSERFPFGEVTRIDVGSQSRGHRRSRVR